MHPWRGSVKGAWLHVEGSGERTGPQGVRLPPRLRTLVDLVEPSIVVGDVGTGDCLVPVALVKMGKAQRVIACDLSRAALARCLQTLIRHGVMREVELRQGDGLRPLGRGEADVVIVAGTGGLTVARLLARGPTDVAGKYVLGPVSHAKELRLFLRGEGFILLDEAITRQEGRFYEFEVVLPPGRLSLRNRGPQGESREERFALSLGGEIGALLWRRRDPVLREYLTYLEEKLRALEQRMPASLFARRYGSLRQELTDMLSKWGLGKRS